MESGDIAFAVLPAENSISGTFHSILDRLVSSKLKIVGEISCVQELCLCAHETATLGDISRILSHPAILDHCEQYISDLDKKRPKGSPIERQTTWDSAGACQQVKTEGAVGVAAVASEQAAATHGLKVLEKGVGDELNNETRYVILAKASAKALSAGPSSAPNTKASVAIAVPNEPQALFKIVRLVLLCVRYYRLCHVDSDALLRPKKGGGFLAAQSDHHQDREPPGVDRRQSLLVQDPPLVQRRLLFVALRWSIGSSS